MGIVSTGNKGNRTSTSRTPRRLASGLAVGALLIAAWWPSAAHAAVTASTDDLWDISQGSIVTSSSATLGASIEGMFGSAVTIEGGNTIFAGFLPAGTEHQVEWTTPDPVSLSSFFLWASHDSDGADNRGFSRFDLYAKSPIGDWVEVFSFAPANPYSATPTPPNSTLGFEASGERFALCANIDPVTSSDFRAVFVQRGTASFRSGPRVLELDGYDVADCGEIVDTDGDGVPDADDAYPEDETRAVSCPPGFYGAFECAPADAGYFAPGDTVEQTACPLGFFSDFQGAVECTPAPVGFYVDTIAAQAATACPAGTTTTGVASTSVDDCIPIDTDGDGIPDSDDAYPDSDLRATVIIDGEDTGVENVVLDDGASFNDLIAQAAQDADNHGQFVSAVSELTDEWRRAGHITGREKGQIMRIAAASDLPQ